MAPARHLILLLTGLVSSASLQAQCRLCAQPTTMRAGGTPSGDVDLQLETDLSFDRLVVSGVGQGAATIRPNGANSSEGSVLEVGPRATVGTVVVHGEANRSVRVDIPHRIDLFSATGGRITLLDVETDLVGSPRLDAAGNLSFHFGGRLVVTSDADGHFRGDLPITVDYTEDTSSSATILSAR